MSSVYVWLSLAELRAANACPGGMREAEAMARGQGRANKIRLRWDPLGSAWFWAVYPDYAAWLARRGLIPLSATAGYAGTATAGDYGAATAGDYGTATAGVRGTATAGHAGTATAGARGEIRVRWYCSQTGRYRTAIGYVGEDGILPGVAYVVRDGKLARKGGGS